MQNQKYPSIYPPANDAVCHHRRINKFAMLVFFLLLTAPLQAYAQNSLPPCNGKTWDKCHGSYTFETGNTYTGEWINRKMHGVGLYQRKNGDTYEGRFANNRFHGEGKYLDNDGYEIIGNWDNGKLLTGTRIETDGRKYVGDFLNMLPHGRGALYKSDGILIASGLFRDGVIVEADNIEDGVAENIPNNRQFPAMQNNGQSLQMAQNAGANPRLSKDQAMTALLDAVTRDQQCQAAENLFNNYGDQLTPTDRDYVKIHVESLNCEFLQSGSRSQADAGLSGSCSPASPQSDPSANESPQIAVGMRNLGKLNASLITDNASSSGLIPKNDNGIRWITERTQKGYRIEFNPLKARFGANTTLPWLHCSEPDYASAGRRTISTKVQPLTVVSGMRSAGNNSFFYGGAGLLYGYKNNRHYYVYVIDVVGRLTFYRASHDMRDFPLGDNVEIIGADEVSGTIVWGKPIFRSPMLTDFPYRFVDDQYKSPSKEIARAYELKIVENGDNIHLYVDNELFNTYSANSISNGLVGIAAIHGLEHIFHSYNE